MNFYKGVFDDCSIEELKKFWSDPRNKTKTNHVEGMQLNKCFNCIHNKKMTKGPISPGGNITYIITCKKEMVCFQSGWDRSDKLPCEE